MTKEDMILHALEKVEDTTQEILVKCGVCNNDVQENKAKIHIGFKWLAGLSVAVICLLCGHPKVAGKILEMLP